MSNKRKTVLAVILAAAATAALAFGEKCQIDDLTLHWFGETQQEGGRMFKVMECVNGHKYLVRQ